MNKKISGSVAMHPQKSNSGETEGTWCYLLLSLGVRDFANKLQIADRKLQISNFKF